MKNMLFVLGILMTLAAPGSARAQFTSRAGGYTIITPGRPPSFVNPNYNGGYTVIAPEQPPTFINRNFNGGYTVIQPGQPPTFINPTNPLYPSRSHRGAGYE